MEGAVRLANKLAEARAAILDRWQERTLAVYPERAARFIREERDPFRNPVGRATSEGLGRIYDGLRGEEPSENVTRAIEDIVRIRAVQDMSPAQAAGFIFPLKTLIREELGDDPALLGLFEHVDRLALAAFEAFVRCKVKIYELRVREIRSRTATLLDRLGTRDDREPLGTCREPGGARS